MSLDLNKLNIRLKELGVDLTIMSENVVSWTTPDEHGFAYIHLDGKILYAGENVIDDPDYDNHTEFVIDTEYPGPKATGIELLFHADNYIT